MQRPEEKPESLFTFVSFAYPEQVLEKDILTDSATFFRWLKEYVRTHRDEAVPTTRGYIRLDEITMELSGAHPAAAIGGFEYLDDEALSMMPPWAQRAVRPVVADTKRMAYRYIHVQTQEAGQGIHVLVTCHDQPLSRYFQSLAQAINNQWPDKQTAPALLITEPAPVPPPPVAPAHGAAESNPSAESSPQKKAGPTMRTQDRFAAFKRLKDAHPEWSQDRVALEACKVLGEVVTGETVRNTYRLMGHKWQRGDRVR